MSFFVLLELPTDLNSEARDAFSNLVSRLAQRFEFQGLEDWSVDVKNSRVLGIEAEFHDLRQAGKVNSEMRVYFRTKPDAASFAHALGTIVDGVKIHNPRKQAPKDWMKLWRKHYKTQSLREGKNVLHIVPAWKKSPKTGLSIRITPGQAFGTGTHPTTQLCLRLFLRYSAKAKGGMLDFGAGTGVLAIAAAKKGMKGLAVESDPVALEQCRKNLKLNRVSLKAAKKMPKQTFDLVFANVLAPVLLAKKKELTSAVKKDGLLFLSGILATEANSFLKEFHSPTLALLEIATQGDWAAIALRKS